MTILSANLGRGYLVRREGSEDRGWIPSYTLHFQSVADHHHRPVNPAFSPWFKVNPANRSSQRGRSAGGGAASTKSPKTNAAEKKEGSANDNAPTDNTKSNSRLMGLKGDSAGLVSSQESLDTVLGGVCVLLETDRLGQLAGRQADRQTHLNSRITTKNSVDSINDSGDISSVKANRQLKDSDSRHNITEDGFQKLSKSPTPTSPRTSTTAADHSRRKQSLVDSKSESFSNRSCELKTRFLSDSGEPPKAYETATAQRLTANPLPPKPRSLGK